MSNSQETKAQPEPQVHQKSDKFKLLCACISLIERRYDGKRSRLNLKGFCDRINLRKQKYNEMVEKAPVEVILYLMGVLVKLIEDIENGRNKTFCREPEEDATTDEDKERILNMVMDRMVQEEREERERQQQMMQAQIQYATQMASQYLPGFFQGGAPNVVIPGMGSYPMGAMYGGGLGMNGGGGYRSTPNAAPYNPYAGALPRGPPQPQSQQSPFQHPFFQQHSQPQPQQPQPQPQQSQSQPQQQRHPFNFENDFGFDLKNFGKFDDFDDMKTTKDAPATPTKSSPTKKAPAKRRGRPKGSKNKPKDPNAPEKPKRGRGRPKGAKNKPKTPKKDESE